MGAHLEHSPVGISEWKPNPALDIDPLCANPTCLACAASIAAHHAVQAASRASGPGRPPGPQLQHGSKPRALPGTQVQVSGPLAGTGRAPVLGVNQASVCEPLEGDSGAGRFEAR